MSYLLLLFAHHVGDVWAQPSWLIANKKKHIFAIYEHVVVYTGIVSLALYALGAFEPWKAVFIAVAHGLTDYYKYKHDEYWWIYPDQLAHYLQVYIAWKL
jgi:ABC-type uncharacterized transport system permease subunit